MLKASRNCSRVGDVNPIAYPPEKWNKLPAIIPATYLIVGPQRWLWSTRAKSSAPSPIPLLHHPGLDPNHGEKIPFARAKVGKFVQAEPKHHNAYLDDAFLSRNLRRMCPSSVLSDIEPDLERFGERVSSEIWDLGRQCEEQPPYAKQTNAWGTRIDEIVTCEAWKRMKTISAEEGLIALPYERTHGEYSRIHQVAKLFLFGPSSGLFSCPLAMTDGAAKTIEANAIPMPEAFRHLTSRDPREFWTSGQWMTEKRGGSDVANATETVAVPTSDPHVFHLHGYKWFSSATDADMSLALARIVDLNGDTVEGNQGISMFFLKVREENGRLNGIQVHKLKDKLGTRQLPTAELLLDGTQAELVSSPGRGIPSITNMLTITRMHNILMSVAYPRKMLALARDYATRRTAFGQPIADKILHAQTMARMEVEIRGCEILMLDIARMVGLDDAKAIGDQDRLILRLMTPVAKFYTGKQAVGLTSEGLECFGGQGYIEDTGLPGMLRDSQVLPIWEGTSNVMSLDVLRSIVKSKGQVIEALMAKVKQIAQVGSQSNRPVIKKAAEGILKSSTAIATLLKMDHVPLELAARDLAVSLAHTYIVTLLTEHCLSEVASESDLHTLSAWTRKDLAPVMTNANLGVYDERLEHYHQLVYDGYTRRT
eukprot:maker-scaffold708_size108518-snap-gene-0.18 protein:Tk11261 transcript:maker-scaffold708_size108518-snap-gene-0.18-mRNA-1 annotation:"hypothetical protein BRAFLDRAFT_122038"